MSAIASSRPQIYFLQKLKPKIPRMATLMQNNFHGNKRFWDPAIKIRLESEMSWHLRWGNIRFLTGEESRIQNLDVLGGSWHRPAQSPGCTTFFSNWQFGQDWATNWGNIFDPNSTWFWNAQNYFAFLLQFKLFWNILNILKTKTNSLAPNHQKTKQW